MAQPLPPYGGPAPAPAPYGGVPMGHPGPPAYGPQDAYAGGQQAHYPGQQQATPPGAPVLTACRLCGSVPATPVKFRGHQGMIVIMRFLSTEGPFCRTCGLGVFRHMTSRTLVQGWYGYGSFIITPITVLINLIRRARVVALAPPQPNPYGPSRPPMDPGPRLLQLPMTWVGIAIGVALIGLLVTAIVTG